MIPTAAAEKEKVVPLLRHTFGCSARSSEHRTNPNSHWHYLLLLTSWIVSLNLISGCQLTPTKTRENPERNSKAVGGDELPAVVVGDKTIVIDARANFEFTLAHIPRAISLSWTDFTQPDPALRGVLLKDRNDLTRRLARLGISPDSEVVVVGNGTAGTGDEGRLAWTLAYLGVANVRPAPMGYFKSRLTNLESVPLAPVEIWEARTDESLLATRAELFFVLNNHGTFKPVEFIKGAGAKLYRILDVRTAREYLNKEGIGMSGKIPNMEAINTPWTEYFTPLGRPNPDVVQKLRNVGVTPDQRIILIAERGVRSAAVTMALHELGFKDVANYEGGLQELVADATPAQTKHKKKSKKK